MRLSLIRNHLCFYTLFDVLNLLYLAQWKKLFLHQNTCNLGKQYIVNWKFTCTVTKNLGHLKDVTTIFTLRYLYFIIIISKID